MKEEYAAIDLKSFYASVECCQRNLDPLNALLVVADESRTAKTICLAATPAIKSYGIGGRARLFQVISKINEANAIRKHKFNIKEFKGESYLKNELEKNPNLKIDFIKAPPQMALYIEYSAKIYEIYLEFFSPEDIHIYSIDEVFIDLTKYIKLYNMSSHNLIRRVIKKILDETGITATAGIGTNLYLAKIAMDIVAKHMPADNDGVRIAHLNEERYRELLWTHKPITDFWRIGKGYANKLAKHQIFTMGDIARCSTGTSNDYYNEELLYKLFGINAELLIDHAWGYESCTMKDIKNYKPKSRSMLTSQVLNEPYNIEKARMVSWEMAENLGLELFAKNQLTNHLTMTIGYEVATKNMQIRPDIYNIEIVKDNYGRNIPKSSTGCIQLERYTNLSTDLSTKIIKLFDKITNKKLLIRRLSISADNLKNTLENDLPIEISLFDISPNEKENILSFRSYPQEKTKREEKNIALQETMIKIKEKFGKNAILKATNLHKDATIRDQNRKIGGHKA